jgi:iron complex outermembrane receptor protein
MIESSRTHLFAGAALLAFTSLFGVAHAQSPARAGAAAADTVAQVDEIIVTATRREQALSDVPLSISAVGGQALRNSGATDVRALNQLNPSLLISSTGSESNTSARIRGVGTVGDNAGLESSVAIFIDGVYRSRTGVGLNELGEIERVEVLRGPQGTLFGRNASAGLLHIITKKPEFTPHAYGYVTVGNDRYRRLEGGVTGPISQTLAGKIEAVVEKRDGFYEDVNSGAGINNRNRYFVRGQLLWEPTDNFSARLIGDFSRRGESCCGAVFATDKLSPGNSAALDPNINAAIRVLTLVAPATIAQLYPSLSDPYDRKMAASPGTTFAGVTKDKGASLEMNWKLGGSELTSITAYRDYTNAQGADAEYNLVDILHIDRDGSARSFKTFSQELRLQGDAFDNKLDWLIGGFYSHEKLSAASTLKFGAEYGPFASCLIVNGINRALVAADSAGCLTPTGRAALGGPASPTVRALDLLYSIANMGDDGTVYRQTSKSAAIFTHNIIHLTPTIDLTLGARYTHEEKDFSASFHNTNTICPQVRALPGVSPGIVTLACQGNSTSELNGLALADNKKESEVTGTAVLSWKPAPPLLVYGSYSKGYKAGGFNLDRSALGPSTLVMTNASVANLEFDPEKVDAFEVGAKYSKNGLSLSASAFYQRFDNFQLNTFDGTVYIVATINGCGTDLNGGDRDASATTGTCSPGDVKAGVVAQGVELEAAWRPFRELSLSSAFTYTDTAYANDLVGDAKGSPLSPSLSRLPGKQMSNAPRNVMTNAVTWTPRLGSSGLTGLAYVNARTSSRYNTGSNLSPNKVQQGFTVVNARLGVRGPDEAWAVELWAQNLLNKDYAQVIFDSAFQGSYTAYLGDPRTYGLTVRARF